MKTLRLFPTRGPEHLGGMPILLAVGAFLALPSRRDYKRTYVGDTSEKLRRVLVSNTSQRHS
jgi:hypothetical protein